MVISDYHGREEVLSGLEEVVETENPDLIAYCGDVVKGYARGDEWLSAKKEKRPPLKDLPQIKDEAVEDELIYRKFFFNLNEFGKPIVIIPGNMDAPIERYNKAVKEFDSIHNVHLSYWEYGGLMFFGYGGEIDSEEEKDLVFISPGKEVLETMKEMKIPKSQNQIFVFHMPPNSKIDFDPKTCKHIGSPTVNKIIEEYQPLFFFCGHAHASPGQDKIENTIIVNPGALKNGRYTIVNTKFKKVIFPPPISV